MNPTISEMIKHSESNNTVSNQTQVPVPNTLPSTEQMCTYTKYVNAHVPVIH